MNQVQELERAILTRAERLGEEILRRAAHRRDEILREAEERLRLREERETLLAKARAERIYRRRVQSSELQLQADLDRLRWELVQGVFARLPERFAALREQGGDYLPLLRAWLAEGARLIERDPLVAELNPQDHAHLGPNWPAFVEAAHTGKRIDLAPEPRPMLGGILIRTPDDRIRVDNSFEGRRRRLQERLHRTIVEHLLPAGGEAGA